jgi:hypothetical protein
VVTTASRCPSPLAGRRQTFTTPSPTASRHGCDRDDAGSQGQCGGRRWVSPPHVRRAACSAPAGQPRRSRLSASPRRSSRRRESAPQRSYCAPCPSPGVGSK